MLPYIQIASCIFVLFGVAMMLMYQQTSYWSLRCAFRREFVMLEGFHEIAKAIALEDLETAAGAMMEHFHKMAQELNWQNTHSWSLRHPFTLPDWPDYQALLRDTA
jgi:DNA-binding FadR family transcriptional regulator